MMFGWDSSCRYLTSRIASMERPSLYSVLTLIFLIATSCDGLSRTYPLYTMAYVPSPSFLPLTVH